MPEPIEKLLAKIIALRDRFVPLADSLAEQGFDVRPFLADCEILIAALKGEAPDDFNRSDLLKRIGAFVNETAEYCHLLIQAETIIELPEMLEKMDEIAGEFQQRKPTFDQQTGLNLGSAVQAARESLASGELPTDSLEDIHFSITAQKAELHRRLVYKSAALALYWEQQSPEWMAQRSPEERASIDALLETWRRDREEILGELPLEDRRRLEALRGEDFEKAETWDA